MPPLTRNASAEPAVLTVGDGFITALRTLLSRFGLTVTAVAAAEDIPGSYWGNPEAGIVGRTVFLRRDTPVHSALHESSHLICMSSERRAALNGDAGGSDLEEAAVCFLQITLADNLPGVGATRLMQDMDAWGYSFRLGSTRQWYEHDANDAKEWLMAKGLLDDGGAPQWRLRD